MATHDAAPPIDLDALSALFDAKLAPLREEIALLKTNQTKVTPTFRPMQTKPQSPQEIARQMKKGENREGIARQIPTGPGGRELIQWAKDNLKPAFDNGDQVLINPDAIKRGTETNVERTKTRKDGEVVHYPGPQTWGEIVEPILGTREAYGTITQRIRLENRGEWSYQVHIPGISNNPRGDRLDEYELLPA